MLSGSNCLTSLPQLWCLWQDISFQFEFPIGLAIWCCGVKTAASELGWNSNAATFINVALGRPLLNHSETQLPRIEKEDDHNTCLQVVVVRTEKMPSMYSIKGSNDHAITVLYNQQPAHVLSPVIHASFLERLSHTPSAPPCCDYQF